MGASAGKLFLACDVAVEDRRQGVPVGEVKKQSDAMEI